MNRAILLALLLAGCGSPAPPVLTLTMRAGADQNPSAAGRALPVAIHVYQLTGTTRFQRADPFALLDHEPAVLGDELAGSDTYVLAPGETKTVTTKLKTGVQAVGAAAAFRAIDGATWRATAPVAEHGPTPMTLTTAGTILRLSTP